MGFSIEHPMAFVHVPKNAGSSIRKAEAFAGDIDYFEYQYGK